LTNNFKKIIIGQEIESWELTSLGLQELIEILLNLLKFLVKVVEKGKEAFDDQAFLAVSNLGDSLHFSFENLVVSLEDRVFIWKLLRDIRLTFENGFKILPLTLDSNQDFEGLCDLRNGALPVVNISVEFFVEWRTLGSSEFLTVIFNKFHNVFNGLNEEVVLIISL
jgi:hypothetical protein